MLYKEFLHMILDVIKKITNTQCTQILLTTEV